MQAGWPPHAVNSHYQSEERFDTPLLLRDAGRYVPLTSYTSTHGDTLWYTTEQEVTAHWAAFPQLAGRFAGGGRSWVRTRVGLADGFTDRSLWPLGQPAVPSVPGGTARIAQEAARR